MILRVSTPGPTAHPRWTPLLVATLVWSAGCTFSSGTDHSAQASADGGATRAEDVVVLHVPAKPKPGLDCSPQSGNVPLKVCCKVSPQIDPGTEPGDYFIDLDWSDGSQSTAVDPGALTQVCHIFNYKGLFSPRLTVKWKKVIKVAGEAQVSISAIQPSSLSVHGVHLLSQDLVATGDDVVLSFTLRNEGDEVAHPFKTGIFLSLDDRVDDQDLLIYEIQHDKIASGLTEPVIIDYPKEAPITIKLGKSLNGGKAIPDGLYFVMVKVDDEDTVGELNKLDNERFAGTQLQVDNEVHLKPDLTLTPPAIDDSHCYSPGDQVKIEFRASNIGQGEAKSFSFAVYLSADKAIHYYPDIPADKVDIKQSDLMITDPATSKFVSLKPGASGPIWRFRDVPEVPDGKYWLIARIDDDDKLAEEDEGNNVAVSPVQLCIKKVIQQGIDLKLEQMVVKPKGTYLQGSVSVAYEVRNIGTQPSPTCKGKIYICKGSSPSDTACPVNKKTFDVKALAAGEVLDGLEIIQINKGTPVGEYSVFVLIDSEGSVPELNEGNNNGKFPASNNDSKLIITATKKVDLSPSSVGFHPSKIKAGGDLKLGYKIHNSGTSGTGAFKVWVIASPDEAMSAAGVAQGKDYVISTLIDPGIEPLETVYRNHTVVVPAGLDHRIKEWFIGVFVDAENDIAGEDSETNNVSASPQKLTVADPRGGCFEDAFDKDDKKDNNDEKTRAAPLKTGKTEGLGSCGDEDWYRFAVPKGHSIFVTLTAKPILWTKPIASDLDLDIVAPSGKVLTSVKGLGLLKTASALTVPEPGEYRLRVYPHTASVRAQYALNIEVQAPPSGIDLYASHLTVGPLVAFPGALLRTKLRLTNLGHNPSGPFAIDYYLSADPKLDAKDLKLVSTRLDKGLGGAEGVTRHRNLLLPDTVKGGKYYVIADVDGAGEVAEKDEKNNTAVSNSVVLSDKITCATDSYSGNHTRQDAAHLEAKSQKVEGLNVCPGLEDWFYLDLPAGKALSIELVWKHQAPKGIVGVQLVDATGTGILAGAANPFDNKAMLPYIQVAGRYYLHTYVLPEFGGQPEPHDYGMILTLSDPDPSFACKADVYELNNSSESAKEIGCGLANLSLCVGDRDWFYIDLAKDEQVKFIFEQDASALRLYLYANPKLDPIGKVAGSGELAFQAPKTGRYYLQVAYGMGAGKPNDFGYKLKVDGGKGIDLIPKILSLHPTKAAEDESVALKTTISNECKTDAAAFSVGYYLSTDTKLDAGDTLLYRRPIQGLAGKAHQSIVDAVIIPPGAPLGDRKVLVKVDDNEEIQESQELNNIDFEALRIVPGCVPDAYEYNDVFARATPLTARRTEGLTICPFDKDVWKIEARKGETFTVTAEFKHSDGNLDMRLYGSDHKLLKTSVSDKAPEQIVFTAPADGVWYLRVRGATNEAWNHYTLLFCKAVGGQCVECHDKSECGGDKVCRDTECQALGCSVGVTKTCDDGNACTVGACMADYGCKFTTLPGIECEDGDACTMGHTCDAGGACVASPAEGVTPTTWPDRSVAGEMSRLESTGERLYVGSWLDPADGLRKGRAELYGPTGLPWWKVSYTEGFDLAQHLSSAVTLTGRDELMAVGWVDPGKAATPVATDPGIPATATGAWALLLSGADGMAGRSVVLHGGAGDAPSGLLRLTELGDGSLVAVGWTGAAGGGGSGRDGYVVRLSRGATVLHQSTWGGAGDDLLRAVTSSDKGAYVAAGIDRSAGGAGVGALVGYDAKNQELWTAKLTLSNFETTALTLLRDPEGGLIVGGGTDAGQTGGSPPDYKGWIAWFTVPDPKHQPLMSANLVLEASTPADPAYKGRAVALVHALAQRGDGGLMAAGEIGARSGAKGLTDAAVWQVGPNRKLIKMSSRGGPGRDSFGSLIWLDGQLRAFGSRDAGAGGPRWYELRRTPTKPDCDDGKVCTIDACDPAKGCSHRLMKEGASCGDKMICHAGACIEQH